MGRRFVAASLYATVRSEQSISNPQSNQRTIAFRGRACILNPYTVLL